MPVAQINGASLYYEMQGKGAALLFIHGVGLTHRMFAPQLEYFSNYYRVIACDLRGNGRSGKLRQSPERIIDLQCLDLILLMNMLDIRKAVFVGISYGGLIVQQMAVQYPERVQAMVIVDSFCRSGTTTIAGKLRLAAAHLSGLSGYAPAELMLPSLRLMYRRWNLAYREIRRNMLDRRPREWYMQRLAASRIDYSAQLAAIRQPALCIAGDFTEYGVDCMKEVASYLPHSQLAIIPDACDPSNLCQPELFNLIVRRFLLENQQENRPPGLLPREEFG